MTTNAEFVAGLRELADWFEANPEIPAPCDPDIGHYSMETKEDAAKVLRALSPCDKTYSDEMLSIHRKFGAVTLKFAFWRKEVCVKKVVGKREVPEVKLPAEPAEPERIIPAHVEEITEWDCGPLLGKDENASQSA